MWLLGLDVAIFDSNKKEWPFRNEVRVVNVGMWH